MRRGMLSVLAVVTIAVLGCSSDSKTGKTDAGGGAEHEAKWVKEVVQHFLEAFAAENVTAMKAASTKSFAKEITGPNIQGGPVQFTITSHEVSANLEQASVKGVVEFRGHDKKRSFTILMEKEEGRWKLSSFTEGAFQ